jgi:hypothetical protein
MFDRNRIQDILRSSFPGASTEAVESAAAAIMGLGDEWQEVTDKKPELGYHFSPECVNICYLAHETDFGADFRLFRRRRAATTDAPSIAGGQILTTSPE